MWNYLVGLSKQSWCWYTVTEISRIYLVQLSRFNLKKEIECGLRNVVLNKRQDAG
jgi:hypothetical protein